MSDAPYNVPAMPHGTLTSERHARVGSYELVRLLGEGSMGRVYEARHLKLGRTVAIKMVRPEQAHEAELVRRFFQEARTINRIDHPHIVEIHDFVEDTDEKGRPRAYCVMEHLNGETLAELVRKTPLTVERIARILDQVCRALTAAHAIGVIHRDVKPENIFILKGEDGRDVAKVLDFGVAKLVRPDPAIGLGRTFEGALVGTPRYMSPEQAASLDVDYRTDIYGIGCLVYEMLTGRPPFIGDAFGPLVARILTQVPEPPGPFTAAGEPTPPELQSLAMECLEKEPTLRPASVEEIRERVKSFIAGEPSRARRRLPSIVASASLACAAILILALRPADLQQTHEIPETSEPEGIGTLAVPAPVIAPEEAIAHVGWHDPADEPAETYQTSIVDVEGVAGRAARRASHQLRSDAVDRRPRSASRKGSRDAVLNPFGK
jgi:serine/threonine protein kinase